MVVVMVGTSPLYKGLCT